MTDPSAGYCPKTWSREEFLEWAPRQYLHYEFDGVKPVAVGLVRAINGVIARNLKIAYIRGWTAAHMRCLASAAASRL